MLLLRWCCCCCCCCCSCFYPVLYSPLISHVQVTQSEMFYVRGGALSSGLPRGGSAGRRSRSRNREVQAQSSIVGIGGSSLSSSHLKPLRTPQHHGELQL